MAASPYARHLGNSASTGAVLSGVLGSIGTSPLYTLKVCFGSAFGFAPTPENILGILSLIFWAITLVISGKYVAFMLRLENKEEGGLLSLLSLVARKARVGHAQRSLLTLLGLGGTALFLGDQLITPAITVLGAVEGLELLDPEWRHYLVLEALTLVLLLFVSQRTGLNRISGWFGPVMWLWFFGLGVVGFGSVIATPVVLEALDPRQALRFFGDHGLFGFLALSGVVLAVTGGEALYARLGDYPRSAIARSWFLVAMPALILNYLGQGALLMRDPGAAHNPFFLSVPPVLLTASILTAIAAATVVSQAVITTTYALTARIIQLGFCPRLKIQHTSEDYRGQIYIPLVNWTLWGGVSVLILGFQSSENLAEAYGLAVTGTMLSTTLLAVVMVKYVQRSRSVHELGALLLFLVIDLLFCLANLVKIREGGVVPILVATLIFILLSTWKKGRGELLVRLQEESMPVEEFLAHVEEQNPLRVPGTAVYMAGNREGIPLALLNNLRHNKVLHETVILMTVVTEPLPRVDSDKRRMVRKLGESLFRVNLHYGFAETPNITKVLKTCSREFNIDLNDTTFFLSRETMIPRPSSRMAYWRIRLFSSMARNVGSAADYFRIPPEYVVELGTQVIL